jgi:hypothetical protein
MSQFALRLATGIHQSKLSLIENDLVGATKEEKKKIAKALLPEKKVEEAILEIFGEQGKDMSGKDGAKKTVVSERK